MPEPEPKKGKEPGGPGMTAPSVRADRNEAKLKLACGGMAAVCCSVTDGLLHDAYTQVLPD